MYNPLKDCQIPNIKDIYFDFFGFKKDGIFLEIGAYDGESISNTVFLADIGWTGVYVEPVKEYYEKCLNRHKNNSNIKVFNCLVGDSESESVIYKGGDLSTSKKEIVDFFNNGPLGWAHGSHNGTKEIVNQLTLDTILKKSLLDSKKIDLLIIDTEGNEWNIIKNFDFNKINIKMLIIEMHETSAPWQQCPSLIEDNYNINLKMKNNNYKKIFVDDINTIFVKYDE
mgnify:CR=1 FL=1